MRYFKNESLIIRVIELAVFVVVSEYDDIISLPIIIGKKEKNKCKTDKMSHFFVVYFLSHRLLYNKGESGVKSRIDVIFSTFNVPISKQK